MCTVPDGAEGGIAPGYPTERGTTEAGTIVTGGLTIDKCEIGQGILHRTGRGDEGTCAQIGVTGNTHDTCTVYKQLCHVYKFPDSEAQSLYELHV